LAKIDDVKADAQRMLDEEIEDEIQRLRKSVIGECALCLGYVTEYDVTYGTFGAEWRGELCYHAVCLSGKIAVAF